MATEIKVGDVLRYTPQPAFAGQTDTHWCREGTALVEETRNGLIAADTYWGSMNDAYCLTEAEIATAELLFNIGDYDEIDRYARSSGTWEKYAKADRQVISSQHRLQFRWFVRKGAEPDAAMQIANAEARLAEARSKLESAQSGVKWAERDLAELRERLTARS